MNYACEIIELLKNGTNIGRAIRKVCGSVPLSIPFNEEDFNVYLEDLDLSTRSRNALKREKFNTLYEVILHFNERGWNSIKNFGKTSATEVFEKIIDIAWNSMSSTQRANFLINIGNN